MERQFRLNWPSIVEEAKQRRKQQSYNENSRLQVVGLGTLTEDQKRQLTASEQHKLIGQ